MITAGVDCGSKNVRVLILKDGEIMAKAMVPAGMDASAAAQEAYEKALSEAGITITRRWQGLSHPSNQLIGLIERPRPRRLVARPRASC